MIWYQPVPIGTDTGHGGGAGPIAGFLVTPGISPLFLGSWRESEGPLEGDGSGTAREAGKHLEGTQ